MPVRRAPPTISINLISGNRMRMKYTLFLTICDSFHTWRIRQPIYSPTSHESVTWYIADECYRGKGGKYDGCFEGAQTMAMASGNIS